MTADYDWPEVLHSQTSHSFFTNRVDIHGYLSSSIRIKPYLKPYVANGSDSKMTQDVDPRKGNWCELWDNENKRSYYYNTATGKVSRDAPTDQDIVKILTPESFPMPTKYNRAGALDLATEDRRFQRPSFEQRSEDKSGFTFGTRQINLPVRMQSLRTSQQKSNTKLHRRLSQFSKSRASVVFSRTKLEIPPDLPSKGSVPLQDINSYSSDGFVQKHLSIHKRGLFRKTVPMDEVLRWTKDHLKQPLLMVNKELHKDALKCFKIIQLVMGDRPQPRQWNEIEHLQALLTCGITQVQIRDEIYVQLCKQLQNNPGAQMFAPSKDLEPYVTNFVRQHHHVQENKVDVISRYVSVRLQRVCARGAKGKVLTAAEIKRAKEAPFKPSVFGETLEFIMSLQDDSLQIPQIISFLADAVRQLQGQRSEGIFRVSGDADTVTDLRIRVENGRFDLSGITDPNVPASLLKYWLRDLAEPLIPTKYYRRCIEFSDDAEKAIELVNSLPELNRRIVLYMIGFLQEFTDPKVTQCTLMNVFNLAMVFAPNFLRCPSESLTTVFENSRYEQAFLRTLIHEMQVDKDKCAYSPERVLGSLRPEKSILHSTSS
ncbi:hypothetical protein EC973_000989 [Apophysomyces ossiformis]|uniref:Uncharacterized protein n=1 Tax=Apophysomyces ossiformis TaxID=679940 RepID=A0A8H7EV67_9FUNG|nr:hypothetical protein EC973_000989 [Apophysomyces ossiformis]